VKEWTMVTAELQAGISSLAILKQMADRLNGDIKFELLSPAGCIETMSYVVVWITESGSTPEKSRAATRPRIVARLERK
jgi:hypothetical protein